MPEPITSESMGVFRFMPDQWLWCLHCGRFFQGRDARPDRVGGVQGCAFEDCGAAGYHVDIFDWDEWPRQDPALLATWPAEEMLYKGLVAGLSDADSASDGSCEPPGTDDTWYGAALNQDHRRRDAILGIVTVDDTDDVTPFRGLDLAHLALLIQERFIAPDARQNRGPSTVECVEFMCRWPEVTAHGYAVHPEREDYRVSIEGLECALSDVAPDRREALRSAFAGMCGEADAYVGDEATLFAWWD